MTSPTESIIHNLQSFTRCDRTAAFARLNEIFRAGTPPHPLPDGGYRGELVALDLIPGLTQFGEFMSARWLPWEGKFFDAAHSRGDNIFTRNSLTLARVTAPFYRGYHDDTATTYRAFTFETRIAPGFTDPDRQVLKLDYDLPENPSLSVRRVLDEIVQVDDGYYLGKAHLHWLTGKWQLVAYFSLAR